ncbi:MAG TPA: glycoside hydrolase family 27 protein [Bryobacteraceae bacterium]|nr:glycoside hydrolase family 27 protein [Bryobacteraceae bacterium]
MRRLLATLLFSFCTTRVSAQIAPTPPMGWNSWDSYGLTVTEQEFKANVDWLNANLKQHGWQYVVVDEGWYLKNPENRGKPAWQFTLGKYGRFFPATNRFPSAANSQGFKPLADYVHSLGLKFGIHIIRGIPREAVHKNLPIADSNYHAGDAADKSDTCSWNPDNYGVRDNAAGQAYYDSLAALYARWGLDFVKVDCIASRPFKGDEIRMIHNALGKTHRSIALSLSPGPTSLANADVVALNAQMWRISDDFWDIWRNGPGDEWEQNLHDQFATAEGWAPHDQSGHWPDADMLPIGYLGPRPGEGAPRQSRLTHDEQRTLITLWSIFRSPLIMGGNLTRNDDWTTSLMTNQEVLDVDQHSSSNRPVIVSNRTVVWSALPASGHGCYLAVFNRGDTTLDIALDWNEFGLPGTKYNLRDLWEHRDLGAAKLLKVTLQPHASRLLLLSDAL